MKYVALCGGLGNQMFQYTYLLMLREQGRDVSVFLPSTQWEHPGGFELSRVFGIEYKPCFWEKMYRFSRITRKLFSLTHKTYSGKNFRVVDTDFCPPARYGYFFGTWQSERYFVNLERVMEAFRFREDLLNDKTVDLAKLLGKEDVTVSVHIRRGDYLSVTFASGFGNCCPIEYYQRAIDYMKQRFGNIQFFVFSDDMAWVKENLALDNATYVNWNSGADSWQDMYLMSKCKHNIIANSTFSWWGAWLNSHYDKIVVAPKRWWSTIEHDDVVPESWIRL